jgi:hypothetical protein
MQTVYIDGGRAGKRQLRKPPPRKPHLRLGGTAHRPGWPEQVRALRAQLKVLYPQSPAGVRGGHERVALEIIEHIERLDPRALHAFRLVFAEFVKLSDRHR